jgi:hypothetical protein
MGCAHSMVAVTAATRLEADELTLLLDELLDVELALLLDVELALLVEEALEAELALLLKELLVDGLDEGASMVPLELELATAVLDALEVLTLEILDLDFIELEARLLLDTALLDAIVALLDELLFVGSGVSGLFELVPLVLYTPKKFGSYFAEQSTALR